MKPTIAELREICEKATPAPWHVTREGIDAIPLITQTAHHAYEIWTIPYTHDDSKFISAARTALPLLLDEIEKLREALYSYHREENWNIPSVDPITGWTGMSAKSLIEHDRGKIATQALAESKERLP